MTILNDHDNSAKVFSNVESSFSSVTDAGVLVTQVSEYVTYRRMRNSHLPEVRAGLIFLSCTASNQLSTLQKNAKIVDL